MQELCHRCGGDLPPGPDSRPSEAAFCPHCGAPQLTVLEPVVDDTPLEVENDAAASTPPPPKPSVATRAPGAVDWRRAIQLAALVAAIGGGLSLLGYAVAAVGYASSLWVITVAFTTVSLYARGRGEPPKLNGAIGARIGTVAGLLQCVASGVALAVAGLVGRYRLHSLQSFDAELIKQQDDAYAKLVQSLPEMKDLSGFIHSAEYRAGSMFAGIVVSAVMLVLFSMAAGALAGAVRRRA